MPCLHLKGGQQVGKGGRNVSGRSMHPGPPRTDACAAQLLQTDDGKKMRVKERVGPFITLLQYILHHPRCSSGCISLQTSALSEHLDAAVVSSQKPLSGRH